MVTRAWMRPVLGALLVNALGSPLSALPRPVRDADQKLLERILAFLPEQSRLTVPVRFVNPRDLGKTDPGAFTLDGEPMIYVSNRTVAYALAHEGDRHAAAVLASCVWHEEQHVRGRGEADAYDAQIHLVVFFIRTDRMSVSRGEALLKTLRDIRSRVGPNGVAALK